MLDIFPLSQFPPGSFHLTILVEHDIRDNFRGNNFGRTGPVSNTCNEYSTSTYVPNTYQCLTSWPLRRGILGNRESGSLLADLDLGCEHHIRSWSPSLPLCIVTIRRCPLHPERFRASVPSTRPSPPPLPPSGFAM